MNSPAACRTYFPFIVRNTGNFYPRKHLNAHPSHHQGRIGKEITSRTHRISIGMQNVQRDEITITDRLSHDRVAFGVFFQAFLRVKLWPSHCWDLFAWKIVSLKRSRQENWQSGLTVEYSERYKTLNTKNLCLKICMDVEKSWIITFLHRYFPELSVFFN